MKARIKFKKYGVIRFIGHLDVMRFFQKLMRRADIPIAFTGGYSPHMIMSFASPLGIGLTSDGEYMDIELTAPVDSAEAVRRMNAECVEGIEVISLRQIPDGKKQSGMTILAAADYLVSLKNGLLPGNWKESFESFISQPEIRVIKQTKRSEKEVDIRPMIYDWAFMNESVFLKLAAGSRENLKPDLVMDTYLTQIGLAAGSDNAPEDRNSHITFAYHRLEMYADTAEDEAEKLVSLEDLGTDIRV